LSSSALKPYCNKFRNLSDQAAYLTNEAAIREKQWRLIDQRVSNELFDFSMTLQMSAKIADEARHRAALKEFAELSNQIKFQRETLTQ
jgi:hypothetical protein